MRRNNLMRLTPAFMIATMLALVGCTPSFLGPYYRPLGSVPPAISAPRPLPDEVANAVEQMMSSAGPIDPHSTILVSTVQDSSRPPVFAVSYLGSDLSKLVSEQVAEHLIKLGYTVPEIRLRRAMFFNDSGQFMLTNDARKVRQVQNANFVVVGTYTPTGNVDYVNLKLVRLADGVPISAAHFAARRLTRKY
jgi:hypothetical protein